ncbi:Putative peptidoglycan binding domain-containing protein [Streptomyces sp. 2323.1]|uniref:peptidoglycan-binding domain-containing protein n=1 Tax=Streptomyces sp. 2323.1 TaxID=1938841 RepID=UPI000BC0C5AE|nr:peptidoglycan-binding domain-containing protein [Streptomyces sp. 2323.1]SOE14008.1 Putative peptidoglycan binding domain-containing protein [Streptomyces sp. 2323.1]
MTARNCPHCSAPERGDGRPACLCAAVGADDFDPLRVRPYVSLPDGEEGAGEDAGRGSGGDDRRGDGGDVGGVGGAGPVGMAGPGAAGAGGAAAGAGDQLDDLPGVDAAVYRADASASTTFSAPSALSSSVPLVPQARRRSGPTSRTFTAADGEPSAGPADPARPVPRRTRPRPAALVATGAAAAVAAALIGTDALSGGVRDRAAPPDRSTASPSAALPTGDAPAPSAAASSPTPGRSPSPDATATGPPPATVRRYRTRPPRPPAPTRASGSVADSPGSPSPASSAPPTGPLALREGASGPEVAELQQRLQQLGLYPGAADGRYDAEVRAAVSRYQRQYGVTGDPDGVYGAGTRASLESRTSAP